MGNGTNIVIERDRVVDWIILSLGIVIFAVDLIVFLYILKNRAYSPLKAKNIPLMGVTLLSALFWWLGDSYVNGLFGPILTTQCLMWGIWLRHVLGIFAYTLIINYRLHLLHWLFNIKSMIRGWRFYMPIVLVAAPDLVIAILSVVVSKGQTVTYDNDRQRCKHSPLVKYVTFSYSTFLIILIWVQSFLLRNIKSSFNEFRQILPACLGITIVIIVNTTFVLLKFHHTVVGRAILGLACLFTSQIFFWCIMGPPVFGCLFHRQRHLEDFLNRLQRDGLRKSAPLHSFTSTSTNGTFPTTPTHKTTFQEEKQHMLPAVGRGETPTTPVPPMHQRLPHRIVHVNNPHLRDTQLFVDTHALGRQRGQSFTSGSTYGSNVSPERFPDSPNHYQSPVHPHSQPHPHQQWQLPHSPHYEMDVSSRLVPISPVRDTFRPNDPQSMFVLSQPKKPRSQRGN
ncbi:hypothetical protein IWQ61_003496 [Dispira simplex]|nr:hypothetical protein IWQ61_003496 [Dispira simplex]